MVSINLRGYWLLFCLPWAFLLSGLSLSARIESAPLDTRFDLRGGIGSPAPGASLGLSGLMKISTANSVGFSSDIAFHDLEASDSKLTTRSHDFLYERSIPVLEGFHFIRARIGAGAALVTESMDPSVASAKGLRTRHERWAPHFMTAVAMDVPVADLVWSRVGIWGEKAHLARIPWQGGIFAGVVVGGPWLGLGD